MNSHSESFFQDECKKLEIRLQEAELRLEMLEANKPHNCAGEYVDRKTKESWFCRKCGKVYKVEE